MASNAAPDTMLELDSSEEKGPGQNLGRDSKGKNALLNDPTIATQPHSYPLKREMEDRGSDEVDQS